MKIHRPRLRYETVDLFYDELPVVDRRLSPEHDLGVWWTNPGEPRGPHFRLSLMLNTHELFTVCLDGHYWRRYRDAPRVEVLATFDGNEQAERALHGWEHHCGPEGLRWLHRRLDALEPQWYCTICMRLGRSEITSDPSERCAFCGKRYWHPTYDSELNAAFRQRVLGRQATTSAGGRT